MKVYNTQEGQTLYDVALQLYGDESAVVQILKDNPNLSLNTNLKNGTEVKFNEQRNTFSDYVTDKRIQVNTGVSPSGSSGGGFDVGFNEGFN